MEIYLFAYGVVLGTGKKSGRRKPAFAKQKCWPDCKKYPTTRLKINFLKIFNFLKPFSIAKRFQTSKNALEAVKDRGALPHHPFKTVGFAHTHKPLKRLDLNFCRKLSFPVLLSPYVSKNKIFTKALFLLKQIHKRLQIKIKLPTNCQMSDYLWHIRLRKIN